MMRAARGVARYLVGVSDGRPLEQLHTPSLQQLREVRR
jgi:hypothetical protein